MSWVFGPGGGGTPGGANGDIQFNSSGSFSGSALLTTDGAGNLSASANISASAFYGDGSNLTNVTASAVEVADGPQYSLQFRFDSPVSGDLSGSANFVVSSDMSTLSITGSTILSGALSSSDIVPLTDEQYGIGTSTTGYESAYIKYLNGAVAFDAVNKEGATISKGQVVYLSGADGGNPAVALAACDVAAKMPAFGIVADGSITNNSTGRIVTFGDLSNITQVTASFSDGDLLYVQTGSNGTSGSLTNVAPTGSGNALQNIGKVIDASAGRIKVISIGRTNATPNLDKGHIFVGNETDQAIQDSTIFVSASANRVGINNTSPDHTLTVGGDISASANVSASAFYFGPGGRQVISDLGTDMSILATSTGMFISADGGNLTLQNNVAINTVGVISSSQNISGSGLYVVDAYVSSIPADRVLVSTTNGQITSHSPFTFSSDALSVPAITASVGIQTEALEVTSSANGSINIGEGISYVQNGIDRLDIFENEFKFQNVKLYQGVSTENTSNFNIGDAQVFLVDTNSGVVTGTLPGVTSTDDVGITYIIKDSGGNANTNKVVIEPSGSQTIDGGTAAEITTNYGAITVVSFSSSLNGFGWGIVSTT